MELLNKQFFTAEYPVSYLGSGETGGKAKGLEFIHSVINKSFQKDEFPEFEISIPKMIVIRTDIFDEFMESNDLYGIAMSEASDDRIAGAFQKADLPFSILADLRLIVTEINQPLAVRSSSLLEDAVHEPFAGIYGTKMTPNNQPDVDTRFRKLLEAIKYVYASTFFKSPKNYIKATKHKTENEKMAVIIQEIVGNEHGKRYYPEISGVARSYNFYPPSGAQPEDGVVNLAMGLGKTIVDGGVSWAYSPKSPKKDPPYKTIRDMLKQTQLKFWSVNLGTLPAYDPIKETEYLFEKYITEAEEDNTLKQLVSTYDANADRVWTGYSGQGPKILTFAPILKSNSLPLNNLLKKMLVICEEAYESPVETEFAVSYNEEKGNYNFGFLQVRPMVVSSEEVNIEEKEMSGENVLLSSTHVLGNGSLKEIKDIVYLKIGNFQAKYTYKIAKELEEINKKMVEQNKPYLLIGFGRWGTTDPWAGIPVDWGQISGAKVIVETSIEEMLQEMSQASHFFHNVTSFQVSYFSIPYTEQENIDWDWLYELETVEETQFIKHAETKNGIYVKVDGRCGKGVILKS
jgi:hypothetical protein